MNEIINDAEWEETIHSLSNNKASFEIRGYQYRTSKI